MDQYGPGKVRSMKEWIEWTMSISRTPQSPSRGTSSAPRTYRWTCPDCPRSHKRLESALLRDTFGINAEHYRDIALFPCFLSKISLLLMSRSILSNDSCLTSSIYKRLMNLVGNFGKICFRTLYQWGMSGVYSTYDESSAYEFGAS